jgi:Zn/Cd-binding protein ZinT
MISPHGKGCWNDVRTIMKQTLQIKQIQPNLMQLHNATNVVAYLKHHMGRQHLTYDGAKRGVHCCFYEVKIDDVNKVDRFNVR